MVIKFTLTFVAILTSDDVFLGYGNEYYLQVYLDNCTYKIIED